MDRNQLKTFAKNLLSKQEYIRFKTALKSFDKNQNVSDFCFDLLEIVNAPEKTEILVEARKTLPKSIQSEFSNICRDLVNVRWTMCGKIPPHERNNGKGHGGHSPAKRARRSGEQKNALKPGFQDQKHRRKPLTLQQVQVREGNSHFQQPELPASRRPLPVPFQDENGPFATDAATRDDLQAKQENIKVIRMERQSHLVNFGFKILGDLFTEREIVVRQVDENSIAERAGLHISDRITKINNIDCQRARKSDIVRLIKSENKLKLTVKSLEQGKVAQDRHGNERAVAIATNGGRCQDIKKATVYTNEDGWLGCSIRGGIDYNCEVHIISVADGSPAEGAGLRPGDVIIEVNGVSLDGCTHAQAVNLILTSSPPITFAIKHGDRHDGDKTGCQRLLQKAESQNDYNLPTTPLRINYSQRHRRLQQDASDMDLLESPFPTPPPPICGHWFQDNDHSVGTCGVMGSPSALPLNTLHLGGTPPPPYTAEPPQMHRIIQKGGNAIIEERNHGLLLHLDNDMLHQNNRSSLLQNEEVTNEQSTRVSQRDALPHSTNKEASDFPLDKGHASSTGNTQVVQDKANNTLNIHKQAPINNPEKDESNVKPNSQTSLLDAIRNFNPGLLRPAKERNSSCMTPVELVPSSEGNDSLGADGEPVKGNEGLVNSNENNDVESGEADLRMIINQALMKRRVDILDSSQESINESYCSEWGL